MGQYVQNVPVKFQTAAVPTTAPVYLDTQSFPFPLTIVAKPGGGGTLKVEYSLTPNAAGLTTSATWFTWPSGDVAVNTNDYLKSPVSALRFTATTAAGAYEVAA